MNESLTFLSVAPEIALAAAVVLLLLVEVSFKPRPAVWGAIAGAGLAAGTALSAWQWVAHRGADAGVFWHQMIAVDGFSAFAGMLVFPLAGLGLLSAWRLAASQHRRGAEFVALVMLAATGAHLMAAAADLIMLFIGLEVFSISLYVLAGFTRERADADEASLKYFLLGAFASAVFLYGVALTFAATGTTTIYGTAGIADYLGEHHHLPAGGAARRPGAAPGGHGLQGVGGALPRLGPGCLPGGAVNMKNSISSFIKWDAQRISVILNVELPFWLRVPEGIFEIIYKDHKFKITLSDLFCQYYENEFTDSCATLIYFGPISEQVISEVPVEMEKRNTTIQMRKCKTVVSIETNCNEEALKAQKEPGPAKNHNYNYLKAFCEGHIRLINLFLNTYRLSTYDFFDDIISGCTFLGYNKFR